MQPEDTIAHYTILRRIGTGGMGDVYLAQDGRLRRKVALKTLRRDLTNNLPLLARFRSEARSVAALNHPHIVTIFSVEEADGVPFITMEYVEGQPLDTVLLTGSIPAEACLVLTRQLIEAMATAHRAGIVHRDLKPGNIMITPDQQVKVLDFGLAKVIDHGSPSSGMTTVGCDPTAGFTTPGLMLGTLPYMSPEQVQGRTADTRSDVFAIGTILYEMAAGQRPFVAKSPAELATAILRDTPHPLVRLRPDLPRFYLDAVSRCLQKDPGARFTDAGELLAAFTTMHDSAATSAVSSAGETRTGINLTMAVLDFDNITGDPESSWLATGIADTVTVDLNKMSGIQVVARERVVAAWKAHPGQDNAAALTIGREMNVDYMIRGAYQKLGDRIRITGQLLDVASQSLCGSTKLDGDMAQIFELQDSVLTGLLESAALDVSASDIKKIEQRETQALQAYEQYAKARERILHMGLPAFQEAEVLLRRALDLDPDYAQAHAAFGQMRAMSYIGTTDPRDLDEALEHLERAVALDSDLGEPYLWLAYCLARRGDFEAAIRAGRRAIALERSRAEAYYFTATSYWMRGAAHYEPGDWEKAAVELERAARLNPTYQPTLMVLADVAIRLGRIDQARTALKQAVELESSGKGEAARFVGGETQLGLLELEQGNLDLAENHFHASLRRLQTSQHVYAPQFYSLTLLGLARVAEVRGDPAAALTHLEEASARGERFPRALGMGRVLARIHFWQAGIAARRGDQSRARQILARADELFTRQHRFDFSGIFCCVDADILLDRATALDDLGLAVEAAATRNQARSKGWLG